MNPFGHLKESLSASRSGPTSVLSGTTSTASKAPLEKLSGALVIGSAVDRAVKDCVLRVDQGGERLRRDQREIPSS